MLYVLFDFQNQCDDIAVTRILNHSVRRVESKKYYTRRSTDESVVCFVFWSHVTRTGISPSRGPTCRQSSREHPARHRRRPDRRWGGRVASNVVVVVVFVVTRRNKHDVRAHKTWRQKTDTTADRNRRKDKKSKTNNNSILSVRVPSRRRANT